MKLNILYRGPLESCNYACRYCPFAKHQETREEHAADGRALERFLDWVAGRTDDRIGVLITPWGEALIRRRYQHALARLTHMSNVDKAAIQTNLSCRLEWVEDCDKSKLALWTTYHPTQTTRARFLAKCEELARRGVRYSVGVVGLKEQAAEIAALRRELSPDVYMWINAYKRRVEYYDPQIIEQFTALDPLFPTNNTNHPSRGRPCQAGHTAISVDGDGTVRRCHFLKRPIANIYEPGFEAALFPRVCAKPTCDCYIGYVHMDDLGLYEVFGDGVLERIPARTLWRSGSA